MLEILEMIAMVGILLSLGSWIVLGSLVVLDKSFKAIFFVITKIFLDRSVTYDTFNTCWDDVKRSH